MFDQFDLFSTTTISSGLGLFPIGATPPSVDPKDQDPVILSSKAVLAPATDFRLAGDRALARGWRDRARDNLAAIRLAAEIIVQGRPATAEEQAVLVKFVGFGATDLAQNVFRRPGEKSFPRGWTEIGEELERLVARSDYASLARCTQYAHYTPEPIVRAIWAGLLRLGFAGGRILEPGIGTGLFAALMPEEVRSRSHVTGIEIDPVTARIARLLHPGARILNEDFARAELPATFDLAIGNPPFSDRIVRSDPAFRDLALRLHDFFIVKAIDRLEPGGLAAFVTSTGTMDKVDGAARRHIAGLADLVGAIRLPDPKGDLSFDRETLQRAARSALIELLSCKLNQTNSGLVAEIAGASIGADTFLPNMGTEEYLSCLSRSALEAVCTKSTTQPRQRVKDTRAALVAEFETKGFVHAAALFKPDRASVKVWQEGVANALDAAARRERYTRDDADLDEEPGDSGPATSGADDYDEPETAYAIAAE